MKRVIVVGACLCTMLGISAVGAGSASALPIRLPGYGECYRDAPNGDFIDSSCNVENSGKNFEWCWTAYSGLAACPGRPWNWANTPWQLNTAQKATFSCTSLTGTGGFTGLGTTSATSAALNGCTLNHASTCSSLEAEPGQVRLDGIEGTLGYIDAEQHSVGFELSGPAPLEFSCGGTPVVLRGAVIGTVKANKSTAKLSIAFREAPKSVPRITGFEGEPPVALEMSIGGGPFVRAAVKATIKQSYEGKLKTEIRCLNSETEAVEAC